MVAHCYLRSDTPVWDLDGRGGLDRTRPLEDCRGHTCKVQLDALRDGPRGFTFDFILELERDYPDDLVTVQVESLQQTFNRAQNLIDSLQQNRGHR